MTKWTGQLKGLPRFISHAFDFAQAPRKGMGSSRFVYADHGIVLDVFDTGFDLAFGLWVLDSRRYAFDVVVRQEVVKTLRKSRSIAAGVVIAYQNGSVVAHDAVGQSAEVSECRFHPVEPCLLSLMQVRLCKDTARIA